MEVVIMGIVIVAVQIASTVVLFRQGKRPISAVLAQPKRADPNIDPLHQG
jgi:hypothetical protein